MALKVLLQKKKPILPFPMQKKKPIFILRLTASQGPANHPNGFLAHNGEKISPKIYFWAFLKIWWVREGDVFEKNDENLTIGMQKTLQFSRIWAHFAEKVPFLTQQMLRKSQK